MRKNQIARVGITALMVCSLSLMAGCAGGTSSDSSTTTGSAAQEAVVGTPPLQPADHADRAEDPADRCYGCHGNGSLANPQLADAVALPDDHYADGTAESRQIEPAREQCITCHPVA